MQATGSLDATKISLGTGNRPGGLYLQPNKEGLMSSKYLSNALNPPTQRESLPGMVQNAAGGYAYAVDPWTRLDRFLILGSEGGSYYASEQKLTRENAKVVEELAKVDGIRLVNRIVEISEAGRAPKNDPAVLALAIAARVGDENTRRHAYAMLPRVCRIGTHLYHFVQFATQLGGWGRGLRNAVAKWFNNKPASQLAMQLVKYQSRDGWSSRDLLRLSHAKPATDDHGALYSWATKGYDDTAAEGKILPPIIDAFEEAKTTQDVSRLLTLITDYKLPRECVPTQWLTKPEVWEALLPHMGLTAMIRNLGTMTKIGFIAPLSQAMKDVVAKLGDTEALRKSRVHPMAVLVAMKTYEQGRGVRGSSTWTPVQPVVDALDGAFYGAFQNVRPTGKNTLLALDVSGSMTCGTIAGMSGITPRIGSAAMALVTAATEPNCHIVGFSATARGFGGMHGGGDPGMQDIPISPKMRLTDAIRVIEQVPMGGTDCSLPMRWATEQLKRGMKIESFAVYTDSETWAGPVHPSAALKTYRQKSGLNARSAVVGMLANNFTIADPNDPGMLDVVGFDTAAPAIMADFFRGEVSSDEITNDEEPLSE